MNSNIVSEVQIPANDGAIHEWFELTYAQFLTLPRVVMSAMPGEWQSKMVALLEELDATFDYLPGDGRSYWTRVAVAPEWPYEDDDGNPIEPAMEDPPEDLCNYRHPRIEHRRKVPAA